MSKLLYFLLDQSYKKIDLIKNKFELNFEIMEHYYVKKC